MDNAESNDHRSSLVSSTAEFTHAHLNGREPCSESPQIPPNRLLTKDEQPHLIQDLTSDTSKDMPSSKPVDTTELDGSRLHAPESSSGGPPASQDVHSTQDKQSRQVPQLPGDNIRDFPLNRPEDEPTLIPLSFEATSAYLRIHNIPWWQVEQFLEPAQKHQLSQ